MKLITILGPTATGKTKLAAHLANNIGGEIISADSRQVFRRMNIGTGKDYDDYIVGGNTLPYHLIDIAEPGDEFSVFDFYKNFIIASNDILSRGNIPVLCGGTGLYIEAVLRKYDLREVPVNIVLRNELLEKSESELISILSGFKKLHNTTDTVSRERLLHAIEIESYRRDNPPNKDAMPDWNTYIFGVNYERAVVKQRITDRLHERLTNGMIEEVKSLLDSGVDAERFKSYGLEYKFITQYLLNEITYDEMFKLLNTAIHRFSKRQMTWFRRMERNGIKIHWLNPVFTVEEKVELMVQMVNNH